MKFLTTFVLIVISVFCVVAQTNNAEDISLLKPNDRVYADAINASAMFEQNGLKITGIHRSKLEGFFRDVWNAALFRTELGAFEIIFFPEFDQAEKIAITEKRDGKRYIYSFKGQPKPNPPSDIINAAYPIQFVAKGKMFVIVNDNEKLAESLRKILL